MSEKETPAQWQQKMFKQLEGWDEWIEELEAIKAASKSKEAHEWTYWDQLEHDEQVEAYLEQMWDGTESNEEDKN